LILVDVDHFKQVNDTHGHEAGDAVLRAVGKFLEGHTRTSDVVCRFGGEEFVLILPEASADATVRRAEELRQGVRGCEIEYFGQKIGRVCISAGVSVFPQHGAARLPSLITKFEAHWNRGKYPSDPIAYLGSDEGLHTFYFITSISVSF
jgi:diguanylate cyclase (GGDEF)-like protein